MQLAKYHVRAKHKIGDAYWEATVLATGSYVAALFFQNYTKSLTVPTVLEKNKKRFDIRNGNKSYRRAMKIGLDKKKNKLTVKQKNVLKKKDETEKERLMKMFHYCSIVEENPYVVV